MDTPTLYIRNYKEGRLVSEDIALTVVDIFYNESFENQIDSDQEVTVACVHWDREEDGPVSVISLLQDGDSIIRDVTLCRSFCTTKERLSSFVSDIYKDLHARLLTVKLQPLSFTFKHRERDDFVKHGKLFMNHFKKFVSMVDVKVKLKVLREIPESCRCIRHGFARVDARTQHFRTNSEYSESISISAKSVDKERLEKKRDPSGVSWEVESSRQEEEKQQQQQHSDYRDKLATDGDNTKRSSCHAETPSSKNPSASKLSPYTSPSSHRGEQLSVDADGKRNIDMPLELTAQQATNSMPENHPGPINKQEADNKDATLSSVDEASATSPAAVSGHQPPDEASKSRSAEYSQKALVSSDNKVCNTQNVEGKSTLKEKSSCSSKESGQRLPTASHGQTPDSAASQKPDLASQKPALPTFDNNGVPDFQSMLEYASQCKRDMRANLLQVTRGGQGDADQIFETGLATMAELMDHMKDVPGVSRLWDPLVEAQEEATRLVTQHASTSEPRADASLDTILCLDLSGSIGNRGLQQVKEIASRFLNGIEAIAENHSIEENIGIITLGGKVKLRQHLTNDYGRVRECIDSLEVGGTSPLVHIFVIVMGILNKAGICVFGGVRVTPRVIILTDGIPTMEAEENAPDSPHAVDVAKLQLFATVGGYGTDEFKSILSPIVWIPVGKADKTYIRSLVKQCKGEYVEPDDVEKLCQYQRLRKLSGSVLACVYDDVLHPENFQEKLDNVIDALIPDLTEEEKREVSDTVKTQLSKKQESRDLSSTDVFDNVVEDFARENLLPLGSRVMRGPDWHWMEQDSHGPGTVINHEDDGTDSLWVCWDNGHCNVYRYGSEGAYDVLSVDDQPRPAPGDQKIEIGVQVERGPDWSDKLENEDGGSRSHGVVIRRRGQRVLVRWKDGSKHQYSFGESDIYEVSIRDTLACLLDAVSPSQKSTDAVPKELVSSEKSAEGEEEEEIGNYVWQILDNDEQWRDYSDAENAKLQKEYTKRKTGSCLIYRNDKSFRVSFKNETERSLEDNKVQRIRKRRKD